MKTREEIENIIPNTGYGLSYNYDDGFIDGYIRCQQDMGDKKYREDDIKEAAYFFVSKKLAANQGILDEEIQDFINSLNKQDNEQLCECSSKILPNGKIQLHLCKKCNEELFKES